MPIAIPCHSRALSNSPTHSIRMQHHNTLQTQRQAGLWLDQRSAILISKDREIPDGDYAIQGKLDAGEEQRGGNEHAMNSGKQSDTLKYFKAVAGLVSGYNEILIFGPGKAQEQFRNFLMDDAHFNDTKITLDTSDHQTAPQMVAQVRDFFQ